MFRRKSEGTQREGNCAGQKAGEQDRGQQGDAENQPQTASFRSDQATHVSRICVRYQRHFGVGVKLRPCGDNMRSVLRKRNDDIRIGNGVKALKAGNGGRADNRVDCVVKNGGDLAIPTFIF